MNRLLETLFAYSSLLLLFAAAASLSWLAGVLNPLELVSPREEPDFYPKSSQTVSCSTPPSRVLWLSFDGDASDSSGYENHGFLAGGRFVEGVSGSAVKFKNVFGGYSGDYVSVAPSKSLCLSMGTVCAWVKPESFNGFDGVAHKGAKKDFSDECFSLQLDDGKPAFVLRDKQSNQAWVYAEEILPLREWSFVCASWGKRFVRVFVDGALSGEQPNYAGTPCIADAPLQAGTQLLEVYNEEYGRFGFNGAIDELMVWNYVLPPEEIHAFYSAQSAGQD